MNEIEKRDYEEGRNAGWTNAASGGGNLAVFHSEYFWRGVDDGVELFNSGFGPSGERLSGPERSEGGGA